MFLPLKSLSLSHHWAGNEFLSLSSCSALHPPLILSRVAMFGIVSSVGIQYAIRDCHWSAHGLGVGFILNSFEVLHILAYLKFAQLKSLVSPSKSAHSMNTRNPNTSVAQG